MKYRQWKKNYKKKYGVNPPLKLDKRKQRRVLRKMQRENKLNYAIPDFTRLAAAMTRWVESLKPALATICEGIGRAFTDVAANLRAAESEAEND